MPAGAPLSVTGSASWARPRSLSLTASANWQRVLHGPLDGSETRQGSLRAAYPLGAGFNASCGVQVVDVRTVGVTGGPSGAQWLASLQLGWAAQTKL